MSAIIPPTRRLPHWLADALERDYCPRLDPYLAWLRQPVGWFVLAALACILVGVTIAPLALSLAAGLIALLTVGLVYPLLATRLTSCEITSQVGQIQEDDCHQIELRLRNRCPWPLWGLVIEGFVVNPADEPALDANEPSADIALGYVPWLSSATYRLTLRPHMRGRYPLRQPQLTCSFPFGLWTARRPVVQVTPVVVRPKQVKLMAMAEQTGQHTAHTGTGSRSGGQDEFLGLREYRLGDSIRHIHWAHTARMDSLVVCERSAAEHTTWYIRLDTSHAASSKSADRENLAWRVRLAASLCTWLHQQSVNFHLEIRGEDVSGSRVLEANRLEQALERLTDVPLDGTPGDQPWLDSLPNKCCMTIEPVQNQGRAESGNASHLIRLRLQRPSSNWRRAGEACDVIVDLDQPIGAQVIAWLQRISHVRQAA